jgi:hypothetical protein
MINYWIFFAAWAGMMLALFNILTDRRNSDELDK